MDDEQLIVLSFQLATMLRDEPDNKVAAVLASILGRARPAIEWDDLEVVTKGVVGLIHLAKVGDYADS